MTLFSFLITLLVACPESVASNGACPEGVPLSDADLPCDCAGYVQEALPGCGDLECSAVDGPSVDESDCDSGGCKAVDCG